MADRVGQQLGNYRLIRLLGRGGFAEVYLGQHLRLGTHAAIKVLYTRLASQDDVETFEKEARTIAHLKHPHIVRILDYDVQDDTPFLIMDYAPGGTLCKRHPRGTRFPVATVVSSVKQAADALQYAHDQRVIHRDVKPENMLVGEHEELLLSDFGIAIVAQSSRYQSTQAMVGTMTYMAPEQIQGHPRPASDQYSLGVVVYEWLSGDCPFHGSMTEIVAQHLAVPPPSLRQKVRAISPDVEGVVLTALEKDPHRRFGSVKAFATALEQACQAASTRPASLASEIISPIQPLPPTNKAAASPSSQPPLPTNVVTPPTQWSPPTDTATPPHAPALFPPSKGESVSSGGSQPAPPTHSLSDGKAIAPEGRDREGKVWNLDKRRVLAMILGTIFCICIRLTGQFGFSLPHQVDVWSIWIFSLLLTISFLGAVFGPWVGLFVGGISYLISNLINGVPIYWYVGLGYALIGFVVGLTLLRTRGRYTTIRTIAFVEVSSALMAIAARAFAEYSGAWISKDIAFAEPASNFIHLDIPGIIVALILLPLVLIGYSKHGSKGKIWSIRKRHVVAMVLGAALYGALWPLLSVLQLPGSLFLLLLPAVVVSLFFGVTFGPWVGLFTGGVGVILGSFLYSYVTNHYSIPTYVLLQQGSTQDTLQALFHWHLGNGVELFIGMPSGNYLWILSLTCALQGFIAGLAMLSTQGRYNNIRAIAIAVFTSFVGITVDTLFIRTAIPNIILTLILLPLLLITYNGIVSRRRRRAPVG